MLRIRETQERRALHQASVRSYAYLDDEAQRAIRLQAYVGAILALKHTQEDRRALLRRQQAQEQAELNQQVQELRVLA